MPLRERRGENRRSPGLQPEEEEEEKERAERGQNKRVTLQRRETEKSGRSEEEEAGTSMHRGWNEGRRMSDVCAWRDERDTTKSKRTKWNREHAISRSRSSAESAARSDSRVDRSTRA